MQTLPYLLPPPILRLHPFEGEKDISHGLSPCCASHFSFLYPFVFYLSYTHALSEQVFSSTSIRYQRTHTYSLASRPRHHESKKLVLFQASHTRCSALGKDELRIAHNIAPHAVHDITTSTLRRSGNSQASRVSRLYTRPGTIRPG